MSTIYALADLHAGHRLVARERGFDSVEDHDHAVFGNWARTVGPEDTVLVLGDVAVTTNREKLLSILATIRSLPGRKRLYLGNHDPAHSMHRDSSIWQRHYLDAFESVETFGRMKIAGQTVMLSHFTYVADEAHMARHRGVDKYAQYRLRDEGQWLLHGHTHSSEIHTPGSREINLSLEAWGLKPAPLSAIEQIIVSSSPR